MPPPGLFSTITCVCVQMAIRLSPDQQMVMDLVRDYRGPSLHIGGGAGHGKSELVRQIDRAIGSMEGYVKVAPWGQAASNIGARTFMGAFALNKDMITTKSAKQIHTLLARNDTFVRRYRGLRILLIDECFTLGAHEFDLWFEVLKLFRGDDGMSVRFIFNGDALQLPPIKDKYLFESTTWRRLFDVPGARGRHMELTTSHRQSQKDFIFALDCMRIGETVCMRQQINTAVLRQVINDSVARFKAKDSFADSSYSTSLMQMIAILEEKGEWTMAEEKRLDQFLASRRSCCVDLFCRRTDIDAVNASRLKLLPTREEVYTASDNSFISVNIPGIDREIRAAKTVRLKVGAVVSLMINSYQAEYGLVNGSLGVVVNFEKRGGVKWPVVRFHANSTRLIIPAVEFKIETNGRVLFTRTQLPLQLCWAMTVHKSQGQTYDSVVIHSRDAFSTGQLYVAFSRCRTIEGIFLNADGFPLKFDSDASAVSFYERNGMLDKTIQSLKERQGPEMTHRLQVELALRDRFEPWVLCASHITADAKGRESARACRQCLEINERLLEKIKSKEEKKTDVKPPTVTQGKDEVLVGRLTVGRLERMEEERKQAFASMRARDEAADRQAGNPATLTREMRDRIEANRQAAVQRRLAAFVEKQRQARGAAAADAAIAVQPPAAKRMRYEGSVVPLEARGPQTGFPLVKTGAVPDVAASTAVQDVPKDEAGDISMTPIESAATDAGELDRLSRAFAFGDN